MKGYLTEEALRRIEEWKIADKISIRKCFDYIESLWKDSNCSFVRESIDDYILHTDGWSSNESIIDAMNNNKMLWLLTWYESRRGGHYKFRIIDIEESEKW